MFPRSASRLGIATILTAFLFLAAPMSAAPVTTDAFTADDSATVTIAIVDNGYQDGNGLPVTVIGAGDSVRFTNTGAVPHTATDLAGGFDTGTVFPGGSSTVGFPEPGVFAYKCLFHADMYGVLVVA